MRTAEGRKGIREGRTGTRERILRSPSVLFLSGDFGWSRPYRQALVRRGARALLASGADEAERVAAEYLPDILVVGDRFTESLARRTFALAQHQRPPAEVIVLDPEGGSGPFGIGLGLLYSGHRSTGPEVVLEVIERALMDRPAPESRAATRTPLVLCVDDEPRYLHSLSRMIRHHGYRVAPFEEASAALEAIPHLGPRVAVVDVSMPGMDGLSLTRAIASRFGDQLPVVLLTGRDTTSDLLAGYGQGACYFISKASPPVRVLRIIDYLAGALDETDRAHLETLL